MFCIIYTRSAYHLEPIHIFRAARKRYIERHGRSANLKVLFSISLLCDIVIPVWLGLPRVFASFAVGYMRCVGVLTRNDMIPFTRRKLIRFTQWSR
jgi:hypothetical protein